MISANIKGMMRNVKPKITMQIGIITQNGSDLYYHLYGQTNDVLGKGYEVGIVMMV